MTASLSERLRSSAPAEPSEAFLINEAADSLDAKDAEIARLQGEVAALDKECVASVIEIANLRDDIARLRALPAPATAEGELAERYAKIADDVASQEDAAEQEASYSERYGHSCAKEVAQKIAAAIRKDQKR